MPPKAKKPKDEGEKPKPEKGVRDFRTELREVLAETDDRGESNLRKVARATIVQAAKGNPAALKEVASESAKGPRRKPPGRPHKLLSSPDLEGGGKELTAKICDYIRMGNYAEIAARNCGVSPTRYYEWRKQGEDDKRAGLITAFTEFCDAVDDALAFWESKVVEIIEQHIPYDAKLALEYLSRRFPYRWARPRDRQAVGSDAAAPTAKPLSEMISEIATSVAARPLPAKSAGGKKPPSQEGDESSKNS